MTCIQTIAIVVSAIFSGCIVCLTKRQKIIQEDNYRLSLFKEHFKAVEPILRAYSYFDGGLDRFIREFILESKDLIIPKKGYQIKSDLELSADSFLALYHEKKNDYHKFIKDYNDLLDSARVMCQNLPKQQTGCEQMDLHLFLSELNPNVHIDKDILIKCFPDAKDYINVFCKKQSLFINQYSQFVNYLKDVLVIDSPR